MALIVLPEGTQISGSIGGTTHSRNRFGAYIRNRSVPVNPNTARQVGVRNVVRSLAIAWNNDLTQVQRDLWEVYAANTSWTNRLGQAVNLTGLNHYIRSNTPRLLSGLARIDNGPPPIGLATAELALSVTASEATQLITIAFDDSAPWNNEDFGLQVFYMGLPKNGAITFFGGPYRKVLSHFGEVAAPIPSPVATATVFPFSAGLRIWVRSRVSRADGRLSEFAEVNFLAGA
ncbi:hypothetical protein LCGC14_1463130 [marine sediment metagenome]|uniref:Uncharacterized protein n=1 Tax=marine sediment metagenome TaxID=412755 RepID=A0A0F9JF15_9ZZZZ